MRAFQTIGAILLALCLLSAQGVRAGEMADNPAAARTKGPVTGLPLPRFVSLKFDKVHLRHGPGFGHRIDWDYVNRRGMPVEVVAEVDQWRRVRDKDADEGWVHSSQLSSRRGVIVMGKTAHVMRRRPASDAPPVALAEPGLIGEIKNCRAGWCRITANGYVGWLRRTVLWGLDAQEEGID